MHSANCFPEFTGRICPAPCEATCTLNFNDQPVSIKDIECAIIDKGWAEGWRWRRRSPPAVPENGSRWSVPARRGWPARQLARAGHRVVVFEKNDRIGGLLRYGIPDFKLETTLIDRRLAQMRAEGVGPWRPQQPCGRRFARSPGVGRNSMRSCSPAVLNSRATCPLRAGSCPGFITPWISSPSKIAAWPDKDSAR